MKEEVTVKKAATESDNKIRRRLKCYITMECLFWRAKPR